MIISMTTDQPVSQPVLKRRGRPGNIRYLLFRGSMLWMETGHFFLDPTGSFFSRVGSPVKAENIFKRSGFYMF